MFVCQLVYFVIFIFFYIAKTITRDWNILLSYFLITIKQLVFMIYSIGNNLRYDTLFKFITNKYSEYILY